MTVRDVLRTLALERLPNVFFLSGHCMEDSQAIGIILSAMLNCGGGAVVLGAKAVGNEVSVDGVDTGGSRVGDFERVLQSSFLPCAPVFVHITRIGEKDVVVVDVPPGKDPPYSSGNIIYALHDGSPAPAQNEEIREWVLRSGTEMGRWENRPAAANSFEGVDRLAVDQVVRKAAEVGRKQLDIHAEMTQLLADLGVWRYGRLLNAGLVLFGRSVVRWLPQSQVRFAHFSGTSADSDIVFSNVYDGPICETIDALREYIVSHAPQIQMFDKATGNRHEERAYPVGAVREALVNAFAHREYDSALGSVLVRLFKDRVEISNSGRLPAGVSVRALNAGKGTLSLLVNPLIANVLYLSGYMERTGRGSALIKGECGRVGTAVVWSDRTPGVVTVTLKANRTDFNEATINSSLKLGLDSSLNIVKAQENALMDDDISAFCDYISLHPGLRRPELQELMGRTRGEIQGIINRLRSVALIVYLGSKKTGGYYITMRKEIDFDYKMIVRNCYEAEHLPERVVRGGYQAERVRKIIDKLTHQGLIKCHPSNDNDSLNHYDFFGFTDAGRELFVADGHIKPLYAV